MTSSCIFCNKNEFLQSEILYKTFNFDFKIPYLLFNYSALTIQIIRIVFGIQKMNEYEYRIALFGPNYSNIRIIRIICSNTDQEGNVCLDKKCNSRVDGEKELALMCPHSRVCDPLAELRVFVDQPGLSQHVGRCVF